MGRSSQDLHHVVRGAVDVGVPEHDEGSFGRIVDETHGHLEHRHARPLAADERAGQVEASARVRQEGVEVVSGDPPRNAGIALLDQMTVFRAQSEQAPVDVGHAAAAPDRLGEARVVGPPHAHLRAVVEEDLHLFGVVDGLAGHLRVNAARVVREHARRSSSGYGSPVAGHT